MTFQDFLDGLPVIAALVLIEGLLSVDNVLGIAALAHELPDHERKKAIRLGMAGAYLFRVLALLVVSFLVENTWVRWLGAGYLIWLMSAHLTDLSEKEKAGPGRRVVATFAAVLLQISLMDLSLSIDNVIAAVGLAPKNPDGSIVMWPIYTGVAIAILALQAIAPYAVKLLQKYPILEPTAFLMIGFVGLILIFEEIVQLRTGQHLHIHPSVKFSGILAILFVALLYDANPAVKRVLRPLIVISRPLMKVFARTVSFMVTRPQPVLLIIGAVLGYISSYFGQSGLMRQFASLGDYLRNAQEVLIPHSSEGIGEHFTRSVCLTAWVGLTIGVAIMAGIIYFIWTKGKRQAKT